jgi:hypothetical protein
MATPFILSGGLLVPEDPTPALASVLLTPESWTVAQLVAWAETENFSSTDLQALRIANVSGVSMTAGPSALSSATLTPESSSRLFARWNEFCSVVRHLKAVSNVTLTSEDMAALAIESDGRLADVQQRLNQSEQSSFAKQTSAPLKPIAFHSGDDTTHESLQRTAMQLQTFVAATFAGDALEDDAVLETFDVDDTGDEFGGEGAAGELHESVAAKVKKTDADDEFDELLDAHITKA